jgi:hypothetical protein
MRAGENRDVEILDALWNWNQVPPVRDLATPIGVTLICWSDGRLADAPLLPELASLFA